MDDYILHMTRRTLLDQVLEESPLASSKKPTPSRLVYAAISKLKDSGKHRLTSYHADILQKAAGKIERVSGFLLIYPTCCVHLIEAETSILIAVLKALQSDKTFFDATCVLSFTEDASELNINLLKWGKYLSEMDKVQQSAALDSVRSTAEEYLPDNPGAIFGIILSEDIPKLNEVLELLDDPPEDIIFDSELVWPKPQMPFKLL
ncbi:hypothetical protein O6H91_18G043500 [Diphasiastrum complanatum]|uniref:Uncharacterized protein n=1 Tax=Diphasiastrum complanatum TaxID=34168 RepID=A0ACC2B0J8_DIPCM|nr:hypothetical protein O6H91_18G043500 [Diphasiastrum complanatum]